MSLAFALSLFHIVLKVIANDNSSCLLSLKQEVKTVDSKEMVEMDPYDCDFKNFWNGKEACVYYKDKSTAKDHGADVGIGLSHHGSFVVCENVEVKGNEPGKCPFWIDNRCARTHRWKPGDGDEGKGDLPYTWCCKADAVNKKALRNGEPLRMQFKKKKGKTIEDKVIIRDDKGKCIGCSLKYGGLYLPTEYSAVEDMKITKATKVEESELGDYADAHAVIRCADRHQTQNSRYEYMYYRLPRPFDATKGGTAVDIAKMIGKCDSAGDEGETCD